MICHCSISLIISGTLIQDRCLLSNNSAWCICIPYSACLDFFWLINIGSLLELLVLTWVANETIIIIGGELFSEEKETMSQMTISVTRLVWPQIFEVFMVP